MEKLVLIIHSLAAIAIIGLILLQQGKGAAAGAAFGGGASQTVFGSEGSGNFFTRATAVIATIFFCTSFGLAIIAKNQSQVATQGLVVPAVIQQQEVPAASEVPASEIPAETTSDVPAVQSEAAQSVNEVDEKKE